MPQLADVAIHQGDLVRSRDLGGPGLFPGIGNDVETPCDKRFTVPAPIPCEGTVTMAVFTGLRMLVYLENVLSLQKSASSTIR